MGRTRLVEGVLLAAISLVSLAEGVRLTVYRDPYTLFDPLGPGLYIVVLALALGVVTVAFFVRARRDAPLRLEEAPVDGAGTRRALAIVAALVGYLVLLQFVGYVTASALFFAAAFRVVGVAPVASVLLAVVGAGACWVLFVHYGNIVFPRGLLF